MSDPTSERYDAIIVGGGPAGSTCARFLMRGGARVAIVDRAEFPRVKLCGGWLSRADLGGAGAGAARIPGPALGVEHLPRRLPRRERASPAAAGSSAATSWTTSCCARSGAELHLGVSAGDIARDGDGLLDGAGLRARHVIGAGGTHCPVARLVAPPRRRSGRRAGARVPGRCAARSRAPAPGATASPSCCCTTICAATPGTSPRPTG